MKQYVVSNSWLCILLFGGAFLPAYAAPIPGQAIPIGVYTDIPSAFGIAYDPQNDLIWYSSQADGVVHSIKPFKNFTPSQVASLIPTLNGVPEVTMAFSQNNLYITDPIANGGAFVGGQPLAFDSSVGQLVSPTNVGTSSGIILQSYDPITGGNVNSNYRPGSAPSNNPIDGLDVDGGDVWLSPDVNAIYKNGILFASQTPPFTTLPFWLGTGTNITAGWSGVELVGQTLLAVAVQDPTNSNTPTSRTLVSFDATTGVLLGFDPDGFGVGSHLEDMAFDGQFLYIAEPFDDANGNGLGGDIYVFGLSGGLSVVPEPGTLWILAVGLVALFLSSYNNRTKQGPTKGSSPNTVRLDENIKYKSTS